MPVDPLLLRGSGLCRQRARLLETSYALYWANWWPSGMCWSFHTYSVPSGMIWFGPSIFVLLKPFRPYCSYVVGAWSSLKTPIISVFFVLTWAQPFHSGFQTNKQTPTLLVWWLGLNILEFDASMHFKMPREAWIGFCWWDGESTFGSSWLLSKPCIKHWLFSIAFPMCSCCGYWLEDKDFTVKLLAWKYVPVKSV